MPGILLVVGLAIAYWRQVAVFTAVAAAVAAIWCRTLRRRRACSVGFVHPDSGGGGGGERVLWVALQHLIAHFEEKAESRVHVTLYTNRYRGEPSASTSTDDHKDTEHLLSLVKRQFGISFDASRHRLRVVYLDSRATSRLEARRYPRLTLALQSFVGALALWADVGLRLGACDTLIDTVGVPFTYPLFVLFCGAKVATYTHYPTISTDMIGRVAARKATYNNAGAVAGSGWKSAVKLLYYRAFALAYFVAGRFPSAVMTNSSWTTAHIESLWRRRDVRLVFPPVDVARLRTLPLERPSRESTASGIADGEFAIVSVGQFRPEKNHELQIRAFAAARPNLPAGSRLFLVGGARNDEDRERVESCKALCAKLSLSVDRDVVFRVSVPYGDIVALLAGAAVGLHAMEDEHFGIVVVEYIAAGCVPLAHRSAGPEADIVPPQSEASGAAFSRAFGELARTEGEFAAAMVKLARLRAEAPAEWRRAQELGRAHSLKFSDEHFGRAFVDTIAPLLALHN